MADNRMVSINFWNDRYIQSLKKEEKLLYLYFLTNERTKVGGLYEITERTISSETELSIKFIREATDKFYRDNKIFYKDGLIFIPKYAFHQSASKLGKFTEHLIKVFTLYESFNNVPFFLFCNKYKDVLKHLFSEALLNSIETLPKGLMNNEQCTMNNEQRAKSGNCLFRNSEYFDFDKFRERFNSNPDYQKYDAKYYYESALNWSDANNKKKADWIATVYNWCRRDVSENKPHLYKEKRIELK